MEGCMRMKKQEYIAFEESKDQSRTTQQIVASVHSRLIVDKINSMNLSNEKRREILEKVILALKAEQQESA